MVEFDCEDAVRVPGELAFFLQGHREGLGGLIVEADVTVSSGSGEQATVGGEVYAVQVIIRVVIPCMEAFARRSMPML
jgi:hypothetical protein